MFADDSCSGIALCGKDQRMSSLIRLMVTTAIVCGLLFLGYWRLTIDQQAKTIAELQDLNGKMQSQLVARQAMVDRLSRSRRLAHLQITNQTLDDRGKVEHTTILFIELDEDGAELARQTFMVPGDVLFVDAWMIKFETERVAEGDPLHGRALVLLRRIYSDRLPPKDGLEIDTPGAVPPAYAASEMGHYEKRLWENFWMMATDAAVARENGVRVAQGEAVYKPVRQGQTYELVADAIGGMSLKPLPSEKLTEGAER
jgi:hypothetical protein